MAPSSSSAARAFAIISPAGPITPTLLETGLAAAADLGIEGRYDAAAVLARTGFFAGDDDARAESLLAALTAVDGARLGAASAALDGLWMSRGGYGSVRTLAALGGRLAHAEPAPLWGFSDGTALLGAWVTLGWPAWLAPPIAQLPRLDELSRARLRAAVHAGHLAPIEGLTPLVAGTVDAPLAGGNLCVTASLVGTPWALDFRGRIAVFEDTGEPAYKVDRLLTQLRHAGALDGAAGLAFGAFTGLRPPEGEAVAAVLAEHADALGVPAARGLPIGHDVANAPLPLGAGAGFIARLEVGRDGARLAFLPSPEPARMSEPAR